MADQFEKTEVFDIINFTIIESTLCGKAIRTICEGASSMEVAANRVVGLLYDGLLDGVGQRACVLVRFFKTQAYGDLDDELQAVAHDVLQDLCPLPDMKCLTLLATAGDEPDWNSRRCSQGHRAIPLLSEQAVSKAPMIVSLFEQMGISVGKFINPAPKYLLDMSRTNFNVFHIPLAQGSPEIPCQPNFIVPYGIRSVLGFGGVLPSGEMFAVIMFFKVPVTHETALLFKILSLNVKMALLPLENQVFEARGTP